MQGVFSNYLNKLIHCLILLSCTLICCSVIQLLVHLSRKAPDAAVEKQDKFLPLFYSFSIQAAGEVVLSSWQR